MYVTQEEGCNPRTVSLLAAGLSSAGDSPDQKREKTRKMAAQTLQDLYKLQPNAQADIQKSAGYAVFNNLGTTPHPRIAAEELANWGGRALLTLSVNKPWDRG